MKEMHNRTIAERRESGGNSQINGNGEDGGNEAGNFVSETSRVPFLMLELDLPPPPLFKDFMEKNIIPQVSVSILVNFYGYFHKPFASGVMYHFLEIQLFNKILFFSSCAHSL